MSEPASETPSDAYPNPHSKLAYAELDAASHGAKEVLTYYGHLRDYVKHEDNLINFRLSWSLTIHAFLLTAYGLLLSKGVDILTGISKADMALTPGLKWTISLLLVVQVVIAVLGAVVGRTSYKAIKAANAAIEHLDQIAHNGCLETGSDQIWPMTTPSTSRPQLSNPPLMLRLPRIIRGGSGEKVTKGALDYYLLIPRIMTWLWIIFGIGSIAACGYSVVIGEKAFEPFKPLPVTIAPKKATPPQAPLTPPAASPHPPPVPASQPATPSRTSSAHRPLRATRS